MKKILFVLLLFCSTANGQIITIPDQKILGMDISYPEGELIPLSVSPIVQKPENFVQVSYTWRIKDSTQPNKVFKDFGDGTVIFGAGKSPHTIDVQCIVVYLYFIKENEQIKTVSVRTNVLEGTVQVGEAVAPDPTNTVDANAQQLGKDFLSSYRTALYNAAAKIRASSPDLIKGTKSIKDIRNDMLIEWGNARSIAFDKYFKTIVDTIPENALTITPDQIEHYARTLEMIGDGVVK